jgi:MscS family membrane protein
LPFASRCALILALAISAHWAGTPTIAAAFDRHPLRPADTSSPRDTLRSFTESINEAVRDLQAGEPDDVVERSAEGAYETFDFRELAQRGQLAKKAETLLFLKEILDRIDLPPQDQIPGDDEVADPEKPLTRWTIPGTRITIARIEEGPRAGEFLFTAGTVARLKEFYKRAKHLPYKHGAAIGIYED